MAKTYAQLNQEIEALKTHAETVRQREKAGVVAKIMEAIVIYGLTAHDLRLTGTARSQVATSKAVAGRKAGSVVKYLDGEGNSWTGMGPKPRWLKAAVAAGRSLESLAVNVGNAAAPAGSEGRASMPGSNGRMKKPKKRSSSVKYKDSAGHSWSGRGPRPWWVREAMAGGKTLEELAA